MTKDKILERWSEYIEELFQDERGEKLVIRKDLDGPDISQEEIRISLKKIKAGKAVGPDSIAVDKSI